MHDHILAIIDILKENILYDLVVLSSGFVSNEFTYYENNYTLTYFHNSHAHCFHLVPFFQSNLIHYKAVQSMLDTVLLIIFQLVYSLGFNEKHLKICLRNLNFNWYVSTIFLIVWIERYIHRI